MSDYAYTRLRQPWLNLARFAWLICSVSAVLVFTIGGTKLIQSPLRSCSDAAAPCGPWEISQEDITLAQQAGLPVQLLVFLYFFNGVFPKIFFILVGFFIFLRRNDDWMAMLLSLMLTTFAIEGIIDLGVIKPLVAVLYGISTASFMLLPFIFPSGRVEPGWMLLPMVVVLIPSVWGSLVPYFDVAISEGLFSLILLGGFLIWFLLAGYAFVYRYRQVSSLEERQQTKWVMFGILGQIIIIFPFAIIGSAYPPSQPSLSRLTVFFLVYLPIGFTSYLLLPASIAFAILRYRLWDIDLVIRRTMVYAIMTAFLGLVYFGGITLLQNLFATASGQTSPAALVISTLLISALFNPLHRRIQEFIDRQFYRRKYDAEMALAQFADAARRETDLKELSDRLTTTVQETLQPENASLWLRRPDPREIN